MKTDIALGYGVEFFIKDYIPKMSPTNGYAWSIHP